MTELLFVPNETQEKVITARYFSGFGEGQELGAFVQAIVETTGVQFSPEQIKELIIMKMNVDMNQQLAWIQAETGGSCDCNASEDSEAEL